MSVITQIWAFILISQAAVKCDGNICLVNSPLQTFREVLKDYVWTERGEEKAYYDHVTLGNYEPVEDEEEDSYPGARGEPFVPVKPGNLQRDYVRYGMAMSISDQIPLDRSIKDIRNPGCKYWHYPSKLPSTTVVLVFHNEGFSVLIRTVISIINRSPPDTLAEVLLLDDFTDLSEYKHLGPPLEEWVANQDKVRLLRNSQREGLIRSKNRGALESQTEVVVFLDAHCEVNTNWLVPLLSPIVANPKTVTVPFVDSIDHTDFSYTTVYGYEEKPTGIFEWGLLYKEKRKFVADPTDNKWISEPYPSPMHAGGLIAVNREYFLSLGGYDPELLVWGGEQYELSFKVWMCGGQILWVPCSRVGHIYKSQPSYTLGTLPPRVKGGDVVNTNHKRVIETWWDQEHKNYFYTRQPLAKYLDPGDLKSQRKLRSKCNDFHWFMENVAGEDLLEDFPVLPENQVWGTIKLTAAPEFCWRPRCGEPPCEVELSNNCFFFRNEEMFRLNTAGQLALGERCISPKSNGEIVVGYCPLGQVNGNWLFSEEDGKMKYKVGEVIEYCLHATDNGKVLQLAECSDVREQEWTWEEVVPYWARY